VPVWLSTVIGVLAGGLVTFGVQWWDRLGVLRDRDARTDAQLRLAARVLADDMLVVSRLAQSHLDNAQEHWHPLDAAATLHESWLEHRAAFVDIGIADWDTIEKGARGGRQLRIWQAGELIAPSGRDTLGAIAAVTAEAVKVLAKYR
jgi:hypothetical protein